MKGLDQETIERLFKEAEKNIDVNYIWNYIFTHSNISKAYENGDISIKELARASFLLGIHFALDEIAEDE